MANKVRHHPGCPAKEIKDTNEKAFQRAICYGENTFLEGHDRIRWIDFELPVENNPQARDCCVDLIGEDSNGHYVLCELKFSGKSGRGNGSPQEAGEQLNRYYMLLLDNVEFFTFHKNVRDPVFDVERFCQTKPRLLVAADESYWERWGKGIKASMVSMCPDVEYYAVPVSSYEFIEQRGDKGRYRPIMPDSGLIWRRVV